MAVSLSPSLRVSPSGSRRVVGVVVVPGKHVRALCVPLKVLWPFGCLSSARSPALPHPWPGWAAVSVGKAALPVSPAAPPSNSATARPLRGGAAALHQLPNDKPGLRLALHGCAVLASSSASLLTQAHPPCLAPSSRSSGVGITAGEKRLVVCSACLAVKREEAFGHLDHLGLLASWQLGNRLEDLPGFARRPAAPHSGRWPVMLGELREAQLMLAVNCGTARTAAEIDLEALTTSTR